MYTYRVACRAAQYTLIRPQSSHYACQFTASPKSKAIPVIFYAQNYPPYLQATFCMQILTIFHSLMWRDPLHLISEQNIHSKIWGASFLSFQQLYQNPNHYKHFKIILKEQCVIWCVFAINYVHEVPYPFSDVHRIEKHGMDRIPLKIHLWLKHNSVL